jgi:acetyltransferase-like isoleucine patch superfamily enzyme
MGFWTRLRDCLARCSAAEAPDPAAEVAARLGEFGPGAHIGRNVEFVGDVSALFMAAGARIEDGARIVLGRGGSIRLGPSTIIQPRAILDTGPGGRIELGSHNSVNPYCVVYGHGGLTTGNYVRIAAHTVIIPANHVYDDVDVPISRQGLRKEGIRIGDDVWVGSGCRILDGVTIGNGAVLAAGAVVHRDVEPYTVVGGVPARLLKRREAKESPVHDAR